MLHELLHADELSRFLVQFDTNFGEASSSVGVLGGWRSEGHVSIIVTFGEIVNKTLFSFFSPEFSLGKLDRVGG